MTEQKKPTRRRTAKKPAPEKRAESAQFSKAEDSGLKKVRNKTPYFKTDPDSGMPYPAYQISKPTAITGWLEVQIKAGLFEVVD